MALLQKTVAPFSEHKGGVGSFLKLPRSNSGQDSAISIFASFLHRDQLLNLRVAGMTAADDCLQFFFIVSLPGQSPGRAIVLPRGLALA